MMARSSPIISEARKNLRVKEDHRVLWHVKDSELIGYGKVRNISVSGMLLEIDSPLCPAGQSRFSFDANGRNADFTPDTGQLVWHKRKRFARNKYLCGIQFIDTPEAILAGLYKRVQEGIKHIINVRRITGLLNGLVAGLIAALVVYVLSLSSAIYQDISKSNRQFSVLAQQQAALTRNYQQRYKDVSNQLAGVTHELGQTARLYQESRDMLSSVSQELESVKLLLIQAETMLALAQQENMQLKREKNSVEFLKAKDVRLTNEARGLEYQLAGYSEDVQNVQEGDALIHVYRDKIRMIKTRVRQLRSQAKQTRVAALRERDKIRTIIGNNGYFVKDGQAVEVDMERFQMQDLEALQVTEPSLAPKKVRVDVTLF